MDKDKIIDTVIRSKNYKNICKDTVIRFCEEEINKYKSEKLVIKSIKNRIHQIHGAFLTESGNMKAFDYLNELKDGKSDNTLKDICLQILKLHASTNERINTYDNFYKALFEVTGKPKSILDIACGFNPFSIPWMDLSDQANYCAVDLDLTTVDLLNKFFEIIKWPGKAICRDIIYSVPEREADVAFLFKILPLVERQKTAYGLKLMNRLNAKYIVVTFPIKSMSGKNKGMYGFYSEYFKNLTGECFKIHKEILLGNELIYIISKGN